MSGLFKKLQQLIVGDEIDQRKILQGLTDRELIRLESEIGRELFGPIPGGHRREFFCLDKHTWIWYEEAIDPETGKKRETTTRYEVQPNQILKVQDGQPYRIVEGDELRNLAIATRLYREQVIRGIYKRDPATGQKLDQNPATL